jgi:hypothetical protein
MHNRDQRRSSFASIVGVGALGKECFLQRSRKLEQLSQHFREQERIPITVAGAGGAGFPAFYGAGEGFLGIVKSRRNYCSI